MVQSDHLLPTQPLSGLPAWDDQLVSDEPAPAPSPPLWRGRGRLRVLTAGLGLLLALAGVTAWLFLRAPGGKDHSGDLHRFLLAPPAGARVLPSRLTDDPSPNMRPGVLSSVAETWSVGNRSVSITLDPVLLRYSGEKSRSRSRPLPPQDVGKLNTASIPDVPGAVLLRFGDPTSKTSTWWALEAASGSTSSPSTRSRWATDSRGPSRTCSRPLLPWRSL